jgi:hypothetical protein
MSPVTVPPRAALLLDRARRARSALPLLAFVCGCSPDPFEPVGVSTFAVTVTSINGSADLPTRDAPLPANRGDKNEEWGFTVEARNASGEFDPFNGMIRLSVEPGAVMKVESAGADVDGRNILMKGGKASGTVSVTAVYGHARLRIEDVGYVPVKTGETAACADGSDNDNDERTDYPSDPGCAFADDTTETSGTFAAGVSKPVEYALPTLRDIQGDAATTPYPLEGMQINTTGEHELIVTRVSSDGFYVTDIADQETGYNSIFAFNFNTPPGMRVCDRVVYLAGTVNEFFGFTELSFPSFRLFYPHVGDLCAVPPPTVLTNAIIPNPEAMERLESGLVRIEGFKIPSKFGKNLAKNNIFAADASNCDFNGNGQIDFKDRKEGDCSDICAADSNCTEWTAFNARGNYKVSSPTNALIQIQIQTGTVPAFDPTAHKGEIIDSLTGTLRNFSGGKLNWTIETRCPDDLACDMSSACVPKPLPPDSACVRLRSIDDNDEGTN